jgi:hypothetical protein
MQEAHGVITLEISLSQSCHSVTKTGGQRLFDKCKSTREVRGKRGEK